MQTERRGFEALTGPHMSVLSRETLDTIHFAACRLLQSTGMLVEYEEAANLLSAAGAEVCKSGEAWRVYFPEWLVNDCLASAPRAFVLGGRNPENDFYLEKGRVGF